MRGRRTLFKLPGWMSTTDIVRVHGQGQGVQVKERIP